MFKRKDKQSEKQPKKKKTAEALAFDAMALFTAASAVALFGNRISSHTKTLKVYAPTSGPYFWIYEYGSKYLHNVLVWLTQIFHTPDAFGWAVIILTFAVKLISCFNRLLVSKMSINSGQRQGQLKSQLDYVDNALIYAPITHKQSNELKALRNQCLNENHAQTKRWPVFVNIGLSIVIMTALYQSVAYSTNLHDIYFLGIDLSQKSVVMTVLSSLLYLIANLISWHYLSPVSREHTGLIYYFITPITTFLSGYFLPSIITLYWITSASCLIVQYIVTYCLIYPLFRKQALKKFEPKIVITKEKVAAITENSTQNASEL